MADTLSNDDVRAAVDRYLELFNAGDREPWLDHFADGATLEDPVGTDVRVGRAAIGEFWDFAHSLADEVALERTGEVRAAGGEAAFPIRIVSTVGGVRMGVDVIETQAYDADGKLTAMRAYWDMAEMGPLD